MSWNKNTVVMSDIDSTIKVLEKLGEKYTLTEIGKAKGMGLNDDIESDDIKFYPIRKLTYRDVIILEQMRRHPDCDSDDCIVSHEFKLSEVPQNWEIDIMEKVEEYNSE